MRKYKNCYLYLFSLLFLISCNKTIKNQKHYENQIGDTPFHSKLDGINFKFCDSTKVLHKRALVTYLGGQKNLESEIIKNYSFKEEYETFTGYFIIRFAVNCKDETGRFRMEVLDSNFKAITCSKNLKNDVLNIAKALKGWNHAYYKGKNYDCYRFITIKMKKGKIINS